MTGGLTKAQRRALDDLAGVLPDDAYLVGGAAIAAHLQHRQSRDLDVFCTETDPTALAEELAVASAAGSRLAGTVRIASRARGTLDLEIGGVPVSLIRYRYPLLQPASFQGHLPLPVASLEDLMCMKLAAVAQRGAIRDFWDLHAIAEHTGRSLAEMLQSYQRKYALEDIGHVIRSLVYFADAEKEPPPPGLSEEHWERIKRDLESWVLDL